MIIYVVCEIDYDHHEIVIAFTDKKEAEVYAKVLDEDCSIYHYIVEEVVLDESYEDFESSIKTIEDSIAKLKADEVEWAHQLNEVKKVWISKFNELEHRLDVDSVFIDEHQMVLDNQEKLSGDINELKQRMDNFMNNWRDAISPFIRRIEKLEKDLKNLEAWKPLSIRVLDTRTADEIEFKLIDQYQEYINEWKKHVVSKKELNELQDIVNLNYKVCGNLDLMRKKEIDELKNHTHDVYYNMLLKLGKNIAELKEKINLPELRRDAYEDVKQEIAEIKKIISQFPYVSSNKFNELKEQVEKLEKIIAEDIPKTLDVMETELSELKEGDSVLVIEITKLQDQINELKDTVNLNYKICGNLDLMRKKEIDELKENDDKQTNDDLFLLTEINELKERVKKLEGVKDLY